MSATIDWPSLGFRVTKTVQKGELETLEKVSDSPLTVIVEAPPEGNDLAKASTARKLTLMALFSGAQFLDAFNNRSVPTFS